MLEPQTRSLHRTTQSKLTDQAEPKHFLQLILCSGAKDEVNERCGGVGRAQDGGRRTRWQSLMRGSAIGEEGAEIQ